MDQELLDRCRAGDADARIAVRNQLRSAAARVLEAPQWGDLPLEHRRELEQRAARTAMERIGRDPVTVIRRAMLEAAVLGLRERVRREPAGGEHPQPEAIVRTALEVAPGALARSVEEHAVRCPTCRRHLLVVRHALEAAVRAQRIGDAPAPELPEGPDLPPVVPRPPPAMRPSPHPTTSPPPARTGAAIRAAIALAVALALLAWAFRGGREPVERRVAWLLPRELPPTDRAVLYDGVVRKALEGVRAGRCLEGAQLLRAAARAHPNDPWLRWYEGLAWVCARQGPQAVEALEAVARRGDPLPFGYRWWWAQALLLDGRLEEGMAQLRGLAASDHPRARQAAELLAGLR